MTRHPMKGEGKMSNLTSENPDAASSLDELYTLIDQSIDSMSVAQLKALEKKRKKIMAGVKRRESDEGAPHEIDRQKTQALRA